MFAFSEKRPEIPSDVRAKLQPVTLARNKLIALSSPWSDMVPRGGLRRGTTVVVNARPGTGGLSLALSLLSGPSANGHWSGVIGVDDPGVVAAHELGLDLRRVLFIPRPRGAWVETAGDLMDGVDLLLVRPRSWTECENVALCLLRSVTQTPRGLFLQTYLLTSHSRSGKRVRNSKPDT